MVTTAESICALPITTRSTARRFSRCGVMAHRGFTAYTFTLAA